jgi:putative hydrolase of the HAD superfamily
LIKNIVFDIGRVLIQYEPLDYLKSLGYTDAQVTELNGAMFGNPFWVEFDRGSYTFAEGIAYLQERNPHIKDDIAKVLHKDWFDILEEKKETSDFLRKLKKDGYKIYFLSNFSVEGFEYIYKKYDFFSLCDGKVVSGYIKQVKPDEGIYKYLLREYNLEPEECLFIDDSEANIKVAQKLGFNTILFNNIEECIEEFGKAVNIT